MPSCLETTRNVWITGAILLISLAAPSSCVVSECSPQCVNGGSCINGGCVCAKGYTGKQCEIPMDKYFGIDHIWLPSVEKVFQDRVGTNGVRPGSRLSLRCLASNATGSYTTQWTLNDTLLDPAKDPRVLINQATGELRVDTPTNQNQTRYEGVYQCRVSNVFGTALGLRAQVKLKVRGSFINTLPVTYNVTLNNRLAIRCPEHTYSHGLFYRWINSSNNVEINFPKPRVLTSQGDGTLYFTHVTDSDVGATSKGIRCKIIMGGEEVVPAANSGLVKMKKVKDDGSYQTTFFKKPPTTTAYLPVGGTREFHCFPSGRSPVSVIWLKDSSPVIPSNIIKLLNYNRTLQINNADRSADGKYSCKTQNPADSITTSGMAIRVIYSTKRRYFLSHKETINLDCMNVQPPLNYPCLWYYNGVSVTVFHKRVSFHPNCSVTIATAEPRDSGVYQCFVDGVAASHHYVYVLGAPLPPVSLNTTDCSRLTTTLSWKIKAEPKIQVSSFIIEMGNAYEPNVFKQIKMVDDPNARHIRIGELSPWANISFRMKAVNSLGKSLPSRLSKPCITLPAKPTTTPGGLKAAPMTVRGGMNITWKSFPKIQWNGNKCVIRVYHKLHNISTWTLLPQNTSCSSTTVFLLNLGNYKLINIKIRVQNEIGMGPNSSVVTSYSGQNAPTVRPQNLRVVGATPYSVTLRWDELVIQGGSVDHYVVTYHLGDQMQPARRRRSLDHPSSQNPELSSMRSRRPAVHQTRDSRISRKLSKGPFNSNFLMSARDKRRLFLAQVMSTFPRTKHKAKRILRRFRRAAEIPHVGLPSVLTVNVSNATVTGLLPFTDYTFSVQGVNSGGAGPPASIRQKTLDASDSSYIITVVVTSETYTPEYEDKTSLKYRNLSETLTTGMRRRDIFGRFWLRSLALLSFRNGSVISEVQMVAANPQLEQEFRGVLVEVMMKNSFPNYEIDPRKTSIVKETNFTRPNVSVSDTSPYPGVTIEFECLSTSGPRSPVFSWFKDGKSVDFDVRHKFSSGDKKSILTIRKLTANDKGNYTCAVSKGNQNATSSVYVNVLPVITIVPRTLTNNEGDSRNFSCKVLSGAITGMVLLIIKPHPSQVVLQQNFHDVKNERISSKNQTEVLTFQCLLVKNNDIRNPVSKSPLAKLVVVKPNFPKCLTEVKDKVTWSTTAVGNTDIQTCPGNATGQVTRRCVQDRESKPRWDDVNVGNCTSNVFQNLLLEAEAIISDYKPSFNSSGLLQGLKNVTQTRPSQPNGLNGGDLDMSVRILSILVNNSKIDTTTDNDQQNFMEICSNILEPVNTKPWIQFENQGRKKTTTTLWNRLVVTVDKYGFQLTNHITTDKNKVLTTENIVMRLDKVGLQGEIKKQGLKFRHEQSSLFLPAEIFSNPSDHRVVSLVYKTLNYVMRLQNITNETHAGDGRVLVSSNTTMVTSTVRPEPTGKLKNNVKIVVENKEVVDPVPPRTCVYWRDGLPNVWKTDGCSLVPSESTKHVTTCSCDHLTIFASLMDPYGGPLPQEHRKALELISTIGCAISLFAILVTIVVMAFFWHSLKGPRTIVLMNICVAIAVVCILVIAEGTARDTKAGCTVMAVLLHYFLLAVFCWMLCEGMLLYLIIVKVIGAKVEEKVKWFLIFGWGFPALIVGISLGATQTEGYGYYGNQTACWLAVDNGLIWAFVGPAIVILLVNLVVLFLVLRQMMGTRHVQSKTRDVKIRMGVKATAVLLPLLGITWLFGLLAFNSATLAFKYLFAIFNSLQGLMIFVFHCILNKQVQDAVKSKYQKYSSTDSTATGIRSKNLQPNKKKYSSDCSPAKLYQNEYEMNTQKRPSTTGLIQENAGRLESPKRVSADEIALEEVDEIQIHKPKDDSSSVTGHSIDEPPYSKINGENQRDVEHKFEDVPMKSNIGNPNCIATVENNSVSSGLFNEGLEDDDEKPSGDHDEKEEEEKEQSEFDVDQCSLVVNAPNSPSPSFSSDFDIKVKPTVIENPDEDQATLEDGPGSPSSPIPISNEAEVKPLVIKNQFYSEEENDLNKPSSEINDANNAKETPPSTPSSFDFGPPLNVWPTESQKSSPSLSKKDLKQDEDSDNTLVVESSGSSDDDSVASYSINDAPNQHEESSISSDRLESAGFDKYLAQTHPDANANVKDSESNENGDHVFESGSDVSSSENMEEFMEYDLLNIDMEESEKEGENVVFKGLKKRDSFTI